MNPFGVIEDFLLKMGARITCLTTLGPYGFENNCFLALSTGLDSGSSMESIYLDGSIKAARRAVYVFPEAVTPIDFITASLN